MTLNSDYAFQLRLGSWLLHDDIALEVVALSSTEVRFRSETYEELVATLHYVLSSQTFKVLSDGDGSHRPDLTPRLGLGPVSLPGALPPAPTAPACTEGGGWRDHLPPEVDEGALYGQASPKERLRVERLAAALARVVKRQPMPPLRPNPRGETPHPGPHSRPWLASFPYGHHTGAFVAATDAEESAHLARHLAGEQPWAGGDDTPVPSAAVEGDEDPIPGSDKHLIAEGARLGYSRAAMHRYKKRFAASGGSLSSLVDFRTIPPIDPLKGLDPFIRGIIVRLREKETDASGDHPQRFRRQLNREIKNELKRHPHPEEVTIPSDYRLKNAVSFYLSQSYTLGPATTRRTNADPPVRDPGLIRPVRPGQVIEIDTQRLDVDAHDPETGASYALELTIALDHATRSIVAWRLNPLGTKAVDAALLVLDMLVPMQMMPGWEDRLLYSLSALPQRIVTFDQRLVAAAARPVIYPEQILIDNGKIFIGLTMQRACDFLGIDIQKAHIQTPTDKPEVERAFGTINTQFTAHVAGYKGRAVAYRGKNVEAKLVIEEIDELLSEYFVSVYQQRAHSGLHIPGDPRAEISPNEAYAHAIASYGYVAYPKDPNLLIQLLPTVSRKISRGRISYFGLWYAGTILERLGKRPAPYPSTSWAIRIDPRNLLQIFIKDEDGRFVAVRLQNADDRLEAFSDRSLQHAKNTLHEEGVHRPTSKQLQDRLVELQNRASTVPRGTAKERRRQIRDRARNAQITIDMAQVGVSVPVSDEPELAPTAATSTATNRTSRFDFAFPPRPTNETPSRLDAYDPDDPDDADDPDTAHRNGDTDATSYRESPEPVGKNGDEPL